MIFPLQLSLEDLSKLTKNASDIYYKRGAKFYTTKKQLLQYCKLNELQKQTVKSLALSDDDLIRLVTVDLGTFNLDI